jgi:hypothetical protein
MKLKFVGELAIAAGGKSRAGWKIFNVGDLRHHPKKCVFLA